LDENTETHIKTDRWKEVVNKILQIIVFGGIAFFIFRAIFLVNPNPFTYTDRGYFKFYAEVAFKKTDTVSKYPVKVYVNQCGHYFGGLCLRSVTIVDAYWPNGGFSAFKNCELRGFNSSPVICQSNGHQYYAFVLLNERAL
jgi:hypothetical protein